MFSAVTRPVEHQHLTRTKILINLFLSTDLNCRQNTISTKIIKAEIELFEGYVRKSLCILFLDLSQRGQVNTNT